MTCNCVLSCLFGISTCLVVGSVARVAIVGGHIAKIHDFPYEVTIQYGHMNLCGGGIIDELHILSAAHCVVTQQSQFTNERINILAGTHDLTDNGEPDLKIKVKKVFIPKEFNYDDATSPGDIAVMKLKHPIDFKKYPHLKPLQLPHDDNESYIHKTAKIAGFGWDWVMTYKLDNRVQRNGGNKDPHLRFAYADVLDAIECQKDYKTNTIIHEKQFCARVKQRDSTSPYGVCTGDSGSPLVYNGKTVIGILSGGAPDCSERAWASLYTDVRRYLSLIEHAVQDKYHKDIRTIELL